MRRRLLIAAFLTTAAFLIAHLINLVMAHALTRTVSLRQPAPTTDRRLVPTVNRLQLNEEILASGLFGRPATSVDRLALGARGAGLSGEAGATSTAGPPIDAAKKVKLIGTVVGDGKVNVVVLEEVSAKKQTLYHLHELIPNVGEIAKIRKDAILIRQGTQQELLELAHGLPPVTLPSSQVAVAPAPGSPGSLLQRVLDRREVAQSTADIPRLLSQARASAFYVNGKQDGWRVDGIVPLSFYEKIGLQNGDVLQRLNGVELRDPGMLLNLFQQVKEERTVTLDFLRNDRKTTLVFDIR